MPAIPGDSSDQNTIGREIKRQAGLQPDRPAIELTGAAPLSYRELGRILDEIRAQLRGAGFTRSARIAVALPPGPLAALAIVGVTCSAVAVPLNPKLTLPEIDACLSLLRPDAILLLQGADSAARRVAERKGLPIIEGIPAPQQTLGLSIVAPQVGGPAPMDEPDPDAPAFILQTSGTTGEPRSIPFSHRNMLAAAARLQAWFELTPEDRCLSVSPLYYSHGLKVTVLTPLLTSGTVAFPLNPAKFDYSEWFTALKPTWYSAGPTLHRLIYDQSKAHAKAHALRFVLSGGASLSTDVREGLQNSLGVPVVEHYGSSEAAQIAANRPLPGGFKPGTCGVPWPETLMVVGDDGRRLPPTERGEVLVRGPTVMSGYLDAPELNRASFVDGWFKSGDIGSLDEAGFLTLHGRVKELINRGGEKVWPIEIDDALSRHAAVAEAAAFAIPHPRLGEDVAAAVVLRAGMSANETELRRYLSEQLAEFKVPRRIVVVDQLPKGRTGKILRRQLSESWSPTATKPVDFVPSSEDSELSSRLIEIWRKLLNSPSLTVDDDFFESGGDSLLAVRLLIEIERLTGRPLPSSVLFEAATVRQLAKRLSSGESLQAKSLVQMSPAGSRLPLIFFHGNPFGGGYVARFARLLGSDQPIFVVVPHGVDGQPVPPTLEAMAADRLPLILSAQPEGPYRLGGYCAGGLVAFEVARLLVASGRKVELVAMIDPPTVNARPTVQWLLAKLKHIRRGGSPLIERAAAELWYLLAKIERIANVPPSQWQARAQAKARFLFNASQLRGGRLLQGGQAESAAPPPAGLATGQMPYDDFIRIYSSAMSRYIPAPLAVRVIYFAAEFNGEAWRRLSSELEHIKLSGDHFTVTIDPSEVADYFGARLQGKPA